MFCRKCGKALLDDDRFCSFCGGKVIDREKIEKEQKASKVNTNIHNDQEPSEEVIYNHAQKDDSGSEFVWKVDEFPKPKKTQEIDFHWGEKEEKPENETETDEIKVVETKTILEEIQAVKNIPEEQVFTPIKEKEVKKTEEELNVKEDFSETKEEISGQELEVLIFKSIIEDKARNQEAQIDKFYTFNKKNEDFQKLLDKEYEKLKINKESLFNIKEKDKEKLTEKIEIDETVLKDIKDIKDIKETNEIKDISDLETPTLNLELDKANLVNSNIDDKVEICDNDSIAQKIANNKADMKKTKIFSLEETKIFTKEELQGINEDEKQEQEQNQNQENQERQEIQENHENQDGQNNQEKLKVEQGLNLVNDSDLGQKVAALNILKSEPKGNILQEPKEPGSDQSETFTNEMQEDTPKEKQEGFLRKKQDKKLNKKQGKNKDKNSEKSKERYNEQEDNYFSEIQRELKGDKPEEPSLIHLFDENQPIMEDHKGKKTKGKGKKILLYIVIFILIFEVCILGIKYFAPESKATQKINQGIGVVVNWLDDIIPSKEGKEKNNKTEDDKKDLTEEEDKITTADPNPKGDKNVLIKSQEGKNKNISVIEADPTLIFNQNKDYGIDDINNSKNIVNNIWYTKENGKTVFYDESVVGALIEFDSLWIDYVNNKDQSVLSLTKENSAAYNNVKSFRNPGTINKAFESLKIGEIRKGEKGFYIWANEQIKTIENGKTENKNLNWIYYLEPVGHEMKVVNYYRQ